MRAKEPTDPYQPVAKIPDRVALEHAVLGRWQSEGVFAALRAQTASGEPFSLLDGPITANNPMGVHHAWGRTLKDVIQRYQAMNGRRLRWQNGFDCQGLWVEVEVEKALGFDSKRQIETFGLDKFSLACRERVATFAARIADQSTRLGMWMDWERSYFTMTTPTSATSGSSWRNVTGAAGCTGGIGSCPGATGAEPPWPSTSWPTPMPS